MNKINYIDGDKFKHDKGKPRWSLLPWKQVEQVTKVLTFGAKKYGALSWQNIPEPRSRYFDATIRHLVAWKNGEVNDPESGLHHLAHAACNLFFLMWFDYKK